MKFTNCIGWDPARAMTEKINNLSKFSKSLSFLRPQSLTLSLVSATFMLYIHT